MTRTRSSRCTVKAGQTFQSDYRKSETAPYTHDEGAALLLVGAREPRHGVEDLDARVIVDKDRVRVVLAVRLQNALAHPHPVISQQKNK